MRGHEHEQAYEDARRAEGLEVVRIPEPAHHLRGAECWRAYTDATLEVMRSGAALILQGGLWDGASPGWASNPDFLRRTELPYGRWTYEVIDTKLAREAKGGALIQVLLYADLVDRLFGVGPESVHLALGGPVPRTESFRVADYAAYFRSVRERFLRYHRGASSEIPLGADPVEHCVVCDWSSRCSGERHAIDHLSLVAGITRHQRDELRQQGIDTLTKLAELELDHPPASAADRSLLRIRDQAKIQLQGRRAGKVVHELLPLQEKQGLALLPAPSPGDLFFDLEGNPYAFTYGIEYLFGVCDANGVYAAAWSLNRLQEKAAFEEFVDLVMARLEKHPEMHIYHYAQYEEVALKRLMALHGTRETEVARILRGGVLIDLHAVVKGALRASVESYSIKQLEPLYGFERDVDLSDARTSLARFDAWLEMGLYQDESDEVRVSVEAYNRDDCVSTLRLRDWLEVLRSQVEAASEEAIPRPPVESGEPEEDQRKRDEETARRVEALTSGLPVEIEERTADEQGRWLLAQLVEFHRREKAAFWWEYFRCLEIKGEDERIRDRSILGGLEYEGVVGQEARSLIHRYRFPHQEQPETKRSPGTLVDLDMAACTVDLKRAANSSAPHPTALVAYDQVPDKSLREAILRVADSVIDGGLCLESGFDAVADLLLRRRPRLASPSAVLMQPDETPLDAAIRLVSELNNTILPIQGPPGAGKTYTAARMILTALKAGKRVGVTSQSHKVINNLLHGVCRQAEKDGFTLRGVQKGGGGRLVR